MILNLLNRFLNIEWSFHFSNLLTNPFYLQNFFHFLLFIFLFLRFFYIILFLFLLFIFFFNWNFSSLSLNYHMNEYIQHYIFYISIITSVVVFWVRRLEIPLYEMLRIQIIKRWRFFIWNKRIVIGSMVWNRISLMWRIFMIRILNYAFINKSLTIFLLALLAIIIHSFYFIIREINFTI